MSAKGDGDSNKTEHEPEQEDVVDVKSSSGHAEGLEVVAQNEGSVVDDFGLPVRPPRSRHYSNDTGEIAEEHEGSMESAKEKTTEEVDINDTSVIPPSEGIGQHDESSSSPAAKDAGRPSTPEKIELDDVADRSPKSEKSPVSVRKKSASFGHTRRQSSVTAPVSEWSHQQLAPTVETKEEVEEEDDQWQEMPALATHRIYDDWGKVLAREFNEVDDETVAYGTLGGAGKGYTRVQIDEDAQSATSLDDTTAYLFKDGVASNVLADEDDDEENRDMASQMRTTKELLTEGQRIAYVGIVRLLIVKVVAELEALDKTKGAKKMVEMATEATRMWGQKMMVRLYVHMEVDVQEQVMVEQLADHGVLPSDLTPTLMQNARVKNSKAESLAVSASSSTRPSMSSPRIEGAGENGASTTSLSVPATPLDHPPAYEEQAVDNMTVRDPSELMGAKNIDLDLRWTVLCDLFLLLIADSVYDSRSRTLLERVGAALSVEWQEICRFEKRVTDALEMQEQADKENWNEDEHMKSREKNARNKRLMVMGLCTVGGGLVIGLSAGMLAPVIGAGLAAGFTGIGIAGTSGFLGGTGAAALIGTTGTLIGGSVGMKTSARRMGAVKTFEYRPLFNNKRVNLIVSVSGWMTGKVDDVRLPFSTVDPIMGDIYSVNWEPDMLQSTGQTISILGTEALTQTIQQILGATFLATLMAGLSLPIVLTKLSYLIDNPWTVSLARADSTGLILADSLIDRNLGVRPITLVGFSLGSRVIFSCLRELAKRGAIGLVQNVYMFGSPVVVKQDEWTRARTIVSGRFVNGFATNDWILAYLFRATSGGIMRVAGLKTVEIPGIENIDVTEQVPGHMAYRGMMPVLLHEAGWAMESVEFSEIEDPDPENHEQRQRELINEIEGARREMEEKPEKKGFKSFFSRKKAPDKKAWETYDERSVKILDGSDAQESERIAAENSNVLFDVDAIRREALQLAMDGGDLDEIKSHMQIREIKSTMPALKVSLPTEQQQGDASPTSAHRPRSYNGISRPPSVNDAHNQTNGFHKDETHDEDTERITMSFEMPERSSSFHSPRSLHSASAYPSPTPSPGPPSGTLTPPTHSWSQSRSQHSGSNDRPPLQRSASASPNLGPAPSTQSPLPAAPASGNPWDDDDEDATFGKERHVDLSFE